MLSLRRRPVAMATSLVRRMSSVSVASERQKLLAKIYAPFANLKKDSPEYKELALSGRVWEEYHQPADSQRQGYTRLQKESITLLHEIDSLKESMKLPVKSVAKSLVVEYAHQSVQIEDNRLRLGDGGKIDDFLASDFLKHYDLSSMSAGELSQTNIPDVTFLLPAAEPTQVVELRNHIVASHWVAATASDRQGTAGLSERDLHYLSAVTIKDTASEVLYSHGWGNRVKLGGYRSTPISVRGNPMRIFPYHDEVPALMQRFFQWRDKVHNEKLLHPLIVACQATAYLSHIHPFPDGNGRVARMFMQDYMLRQGYVPVTMQALEREEYLQMISDAQDGKPEEFVARVVTTQLDAMRTFKWREIEQEGRP